MVGANHSALAVHMVWHQGEVEKVLGEGAKFVTILRHPVDQFESLFSYYDLAKVFHMDIERFVEVYEEGGKEVGRGPAIPRCPGSSAPSAGTSSSGTSASLTSPSLPWSRPGWRRWTEPSTWSWWPSGSMSRWCCWLTCCAGHWPTSPGGRPPQPSQCEEECPPRLPEVRAVGEGPRQPRLLAVGGTVKVLK